MRKSDSGSGIGSHPSQDTLPSSDPSSYSLFCSLGWGGGESRRRSDEAHQPETPDLRRRFQEAFADCRTVALQVAQRIVGTASASEDAFHDAIARVWGNLDRCQDPDKLDALIIASTKNAALNAVRDAANRSELLEARLPTPPRGIHAITPDKYAEFEEFRALVADGFRHLPERWRRPFPPFLQFFRCQDGREVLAHVPLREAVARNLGDAALDG